MVNERDSAAATVGSATGDSDATGVLSGKGVENNPQAMVKNKREVNVIIRFEVNMAGSFYIEEHLSIIQASRPKGGLRYELLFFS
jgi:hypothetical protein